MKTHLCTTRRLTAIALLHLRDPAAIGGLHAWAAESGVSALLRSQVPSAAGNSAGRNVDDDPTTWLLAMQVGMHMCIHAPQ
jgi:hypothetical protein